MSMLTDRRIDNGMTMYRERPNPIHTCPHCGAEWEEFIDRDPIGIGTVYYEHDFDLTREYPIHRGFCRACALESSTPEDRVSYIQQRGLQRSFLASLLAERTMASLREADVMAVWKMAMEHDPELLDARVREYIEDECESDFVDWRAG